MKRNQIQGFRVNIQTNLNLFPDDLRTSSGNDIVLFDYFICIVLFVFVSFESMPFLSNLSTFRFSVHNLLMSNISTSINEKENRLAAFLFKVLILKIFIIKNFLV